MVEIVASDKKKDLFKREVSDQIGKNKSHPLSIEMKEPTLDLKEQVAKRRN